MQRRFEKRHVVIIGFRPRIVGLSLVFVDCAFSVIRVYWVETLIDLQGIRRLLGPNNRTKAVPAFVST